VARSVSEVHDECVEVLGQAFRGGGHALVQLVDERLAALLGVAGADRIIGRSPVGVLDALAVGQL
jgi:hypothetical protein